MFHRVLRGRVGPMYSLIDSEKNGLDQSSKPYVNLHKSLMSQKEDMQIFKAIVGEVCGMKASKEESKLVRTCMMRLVSLRGSSMAARELETALICWMYSVIEEESLQISWSWWHSCKTLACECKEKVHSRAT